VNLADFNALAGNFGSSAAAAGQRSDGGTSSRATLRDLLDEQR
jgi:hypothetical protein